MPFVLDTSALIAWMSDEAGASQVEDILSGTEEALIPWPVLFEILYIAERAGGEEKALQRYATLKRLPARILLEVDEPLILAAARLKATYPISQSDALIAAYAYRFEAVLVHKDPEFTALAAEVRQEVLPFKR